ncbi:MAG: MBL fold metallo-hydrolase [bacterium]|nr:MBL fold metallo-hydrolase [bacterium]
MKYCILASGSEGNSTLVEDDQGHAILIDAGLSMRRISECLQAQGRDLTRIKAILITHEHADHLRGVAVLARRLDVPIYASRGTLTLIRRYLPDATQLNSLNGVRIVFGRLEVEAFPVSHDAPETVGFVIWEDGRKLAIATDLGHVDPSILERLNACDAIVLEANHDLEMLRTGPYPFDLKQRIESRIGHLSNDQAAEALVKIASPRLRRVVLAHLSQQNNRPDLAFDRVRFYLDAAGHQHVDLVIADQDEPSQLFEV